MEKITEVVKLMAKTGLFFANADGQYNRSEKDYLDNFVAGIQQIGDISDELKADVVGALDKTYTLEQIIDDTKQLVDGFSDQERGAILTAIKGFINQVIRVDDTVHEKEQAAYKAWKQALGIS